MMRYRERSFALLFQAILLAFCSIHLLTNIAAYDGNVENAFVQQEPQSFTDEIVDVRKQQVARPFTPFLHIVPSVDGREILISASNVEEINGSVTALVGGTSFKDGWTMTYSDTQKAYVTTVIGFTPSTTDEGTINITTTLGLETGEIEYKRAFVAQSANQSVVSPDGNLELSLISTATLPADTYIAVAPSYAPPAPALNGHRIVGSVYSLRAAGALTQADKLMNLRLYYTEQLLQGANPHTLTIFAWDAFYERWENLEGQRFTDQRYVSITTKHFLTYALMVTPTWRDEFDELDGLDFDATTNITPGGTQTERTLTLAKSPGVGFATSRVITAPASAQQWGKFAYHSIAEPPTTTLTIDLLSIDGDILVENVADNQSLSEIDVVQHPSLRLRANMTSTLSSESPSLDAWEITWHTETLDLDCDGVPDEQQPQIGSCLYLPLLHSGS